MGDDENKAGSEPLYGAPTSSTTSQTPAPASGPVSSSSTIPTQPDKVTTNPLFGATPSPTPLSTQSSRSKAPAIPARQRLPLHHPSPLPSYLRKLSYILSLILGSSAVIAGVWSLVVLPLLHASFSARKALVDQQSDRWASLLGSLRQIRGRGMYSHASTTTALSEPDEDGQVHGSEKGDGGGEMARLTQHEDEPDTESEATTNSEGLIPINTISNLTNSLSNLLTAFNSTSTTRTSLLSTIEGYSSYLHRQVYRRSHPGAGAGYSLGTLSANLAKAGAGGGGGSQRRPFDIYGQAEGGEDETEVKLEDMGVKSQEWDAVRKEVRAIKGMLLSRRNFVPQDSDAR